MPRIAIDPVTRIGGQLRVEVEVTDGVVSDAWSSGTAFRGLERILQGRDPRDAWLFAERICGVCSGVHALASVRAVERALGVTVPRNARLIRNILAGTRYVQDHVVGFYHRQALDWVDVTAAASADPAATSRLARSLSDWPDSSVASFQAARDRLAAAIRSGQLGPFANGYGGHPAYTLAPEAGLMVMAHYLRALDWQRTPTQITTLLGGKDPHPQAFLVGGMVLVPDWGGPRPAGSEHPQQVDRASPSALGERGLAELVGLVATVKAFVDEVYRPDVLAVAGHYRDWAATGQGIGDYLAYGEFPEDDTAQPSLLLPGGRIVKRATARTEPIDQAAIGETVAYSHYTYGGDDTASKHPFDGRTDPRYDGPPLPYATLQGAARYSWVKAPRYQGGPMEVGPLARMLVASVEGQVDVRAGLGRAFTTLEASPDLLYGTIGRTVARAIEAQVIADRLGRWLNDLRAGLAGGDLAVADLGRWDPAAWPSEARGYALGESPRGALGHWVTIRDRRIASYQVVDATTWNASPRDASGRRGALEEALVGTPVARPDQPVEILRTVHSFDPCLACAVHAVGRESGGAIAIRVRKGGAG